MRRILLILGSLLHAAAINWLYVYRIAPQFSSVGYTYHKPSHLLLVATWILGLFPTLWLPLKTKSPSDITCTLLYVLLYIPSIFISPYIINHSDADTIIYLIALFASFAILCFISSLRPLNLPFATSYATIARVVVLIFTLSLYVPIVATFGTSNIQWVSLADVYGLRADYKDVLSTSSSSVAYTISWLSFAINPYLLAVGLSSISTRRGQLMTLLGIAGQTYIFLIAGFKSVFLSTLFVIAMYVLLRRPKHFTCFVTWGSFSLVSLFIAMDALIGFDFLSIHIARRLFVVPGVTSAYYYDFFLDQPKAALGYSVLSSLVHYPYSTAPQYLIGSKFFTGHGQSANANFLADAFANFGFLGMFGYSMLLGTILWLINSTVKKHYLGIAGSALSMATYALSNTALSTTLVTYGVPILLILLWLAPAWPCRSENDEKQENKYTS